MGRKRLSRGVYAFATPTPHYRELNARYNLMIESGRREDIASTVCLDYSLLMSGGYDNERYLEWSKEIYGCHELVPVWSKENRFTRASSFESLEDFRDIEKLGVSLAENIKHYIPVSWTTRCVTYPEVKSFLRRLVQKSGRRDVPLYYFAIKHVRVPFYGERTVLYARLSFLRTFKVGRDLIRYRNLAVNFEKVYGFE